MVFLFPAYMILPFCQKSKDDLLLKNTLNHDISGIILKNDIYPMVFLLKEKLKMIKKFTQSNTHLVKSSRNFQTHPIF